MQTRKKTITTWLALIILNIQSAAFAADKITVIPEVKVQADSHRPSQGLNSRAETTTLTQKIIKESPAVTFSGLLQQEQSTVRLTNNSGDSSQTSLSLRGFGDNAVANTLILVDGFPLRNASLLAPNLNAINLADVERVEIIPGSQSVIWGDQAVGGVVNIITKHPKTWSATAVAGLGNFNLRTGYGLLSNRFNNGIYFKTSVLGYTNDHYRDHNQQRDSQLMALVGYDYANGLLQLSVNKADHTAQFAGGLTAAQYHANPRQASHHKNIANYHTQTIQALNQHAFNDDWLLETRVAHQLLRGDGFIFSAFDRVEHETLLHPKLIGHWRNNKIILGYQFLASDYQVVNRMNGTKASEQQHDAYSQFIIPISDKIKLTAGGRAARQTSDAEKIIGDSLLAHHQIFVSELGVDYQPTTAWQFYLRRQGHFRFPKVSEITWTSNQSPVLQPQTGVSYEAGLVWQNQQHQVQFNLYDLRLRNEIAFDPTQSLTNPFGSLRNFDDTDRLGFSLSDVYRLNDQLTLDAQFNFVNPTFHSGEFAGKQIPAVPQLTANAGWHYALNEQWRLRHNILYTGKRYASEDVMNMGKQLPSYWLHGVALQYVYQAIELSLSADNIFNQKYSTYTLFNTINQSNTYYPGAGRSYLLTLKWNIE